MWSRRSRSEAVWVGWLCVLQAAAVHARCEKLVYGKLGGVVSLNVDTNITSITSIVWKEGANIAIEWDGVTEDRNRHYKDRGQLDKTSGTMTISGLLKSDSNIYKPEINNKEGTAVCLEVVSAVPVPTIIKNCSKENTRCTLMCSGDTTGAGSVKYQWLSDNTLESHSLKSYDIEKDSSVDKKEYTCELKNEVSQETSQPISNPFTQTGEMKISNGLIVFLSLLGVVLLVVVVHRLKAGMWFFDKGSMPWEREFWQKYEATPTDTAESNGTSASPQQKTLDEETTFS
ncbi:unnamed protein product [Ophioblennius macclurei]